MGIKGLYKHISQNPNAYEIVDLVYESASQNGIEILVDFHAFIRDIIEIISRKIANEYRNDYLLFLSGEYGIFSESFAKFHKIFTEMKIKLVWIIDGPKGVDEIGSTQKTETWKQRDKQDIAQLIKVMDGCETKSPPENLNNLGPMCIFEVAIDTLKNCGAEIIQLLQGGSDEFIASEFIKRKSFAIITGDTDFLIFKDCKVIFPRLMIEYYKSCLKLPFIDNENPGAIFKKPEVFKCPIVNQKKMFQIFALSNHYELVALSIIKGNDYTEPCAQKLQYYLGITKNPWKNAHVTHVASYISMHNVALENIYQLPGMDKFLKEFPQIRESIQFSFNFYTLKHYNEKRHNSLITFDPYNANDSLTDFFREKLSKSEISKKIYSIHRGIFYDTIIMEKPNQNCLSNSSILQTIRSKIYPYVLDSNLSVVNEWRFRDSSSVFKINVEHKYCKTNKIKGKRNSENVHNDSIIYGIDLFESIWSHLEKNDSLEFFEKFDLEKGFICYILRYFYVVTKNKNINVNKDEFKALFVTVFYQYSASRNNEFQHKESFLRMNICPTEKCLTIYSWFMNIYYTGKYICGGAFNLTEEFPNPQQLISASVLFAFHDHAINQTNRRLSNSKMTILDLENQILNDNLREYYCVTQ